jgi:hypothetical protein
MASTPTSEIPQKLEPRPVGEWREKKLAIDPIDGGRRGGEKAKKAKEEQRSCGG